MQSSRAQVDRHSCLSALVSACGNTESFFLQFTLDPKSGQVVGLFGVFDGEQQSIQLKSLSFSCLAKADAS